jgi:dihydrofolate reductase
MRQAIYLTAASLDGFIADQHHSLDWLFQFENPAEAEFAEFMEGVGAVVMGATTYRWLWSRHFSPQALEPLPWPYQAPTWVFTHGGLQEVPGASLRFVSGLPSDHIAAISQEAGGGRIWVVGGGNLAGQFYDAGLLDEIVVTVASVTLGGGSPLLPRRIHPPLDLVSVRKTSPGLAELRYRVPPGSESKP